MLCSQDTVLTVPPHLFVLDDCSYVPLDWEFQWEKYWFARPQNWFTCYFSQFGTQAPGTGGRQEAVARMARTRSQISWCSTAPWILGLGSPGTALFWSDGNLLHFEVVQALHNLYRQSSMWQSQMSWQSLAQVPLMPLFHVETLL